MRLPRLAPRPRAPEPTLGHRTGGGAVVPQSSVAEPSDPAYYASEEECICVQAADSAAMGWGPTSQDQEGDQFFRQRLTEFCGLDNSDILVDKSMKGSPYYIKIEDRRCYVYTNGSVVCGDARHKRGKHGMMNNPQRINCTAKHRAFYDASGRSNQYPRP